MEYTISYLSPTGDSIISTGRGADVFIEQNTLEGFVGQVEDTGITTIGMPGQVVDFRDRKILPTEGKFTLVATSAIAWANARRAFSTTDHGTLIIEGTRRCVLPVRLANSLPSPARVPTTGSRIEVNLIRDEGAWLITESADGPTVTITNTGAAPIGPRITWTGAGGAVMLPSGATFALPAVTSPRTMYLDRRRAGQVYAAGEVLDREATHEAAAVGEMVPVGQTRVFRVPAGARIQWDQEVLDPWI